MTCETDGSCRRAWYTRDDDGAFMRKYFGLLAIVLVCLAIKQAGCDRVAHPRTPSCGDNDVRRTLIDAVVQADAELSAALFASAVKSLESDPQMSRQFRYRDPFSGSQETTTGAQLAQSLPMVMGMLNMASGMSGFLAGFAEGANDPAVRSKIQDGDREAQARIRAFTDDPNVKRVMSTLDVAYDRVKSGLRVTATRPSRVDDRLRLCDCMAQITWEDGEVVLMDGVRYTVQYTTDDQLMVTYQGRNP